MQQGIVWRLFTASILGRSGRRKRMTEFADSSWSQSDNVKAYQDDADHYLPERALLLNVLVSFYRHFVKQADSARVLDLGCGDGIVSAALLHADPSIYLQAIDGSEDMIAAARERLPGLRAENLHVATFRDLIADTVVVGPFDCVISAFAIHHIDLVEKQLLFRWVFRNLKSSGVFLNLDVVLPSAPSHEDWYYTLWREWIVRHQKENGISNNFRHIPSEARARPENHYDTLKDQLDALRQAGFAEVECHCRFGLFGIYTGMRP
jgi:tRNA (cmo5U34)-methyltransferase